MKKVNPAKRKASKVTVTRSSNCYCYVSTMTAQWYLPGYAK